jgi:hypothetical protein
MKQLSADAAEPGLSFLAFTLLFGLGNFAR